uniref:Very-long-chain 3-oxoacyl-CoA reductase n=1 Tax=Caenorhabditis japonica TaxID=281687 RepID=A0A8R1DTK0_CAEJA
MTCQCFLTGAGYVALAAVAYRFLTIVSNIVGPYLLLSPIDLKKRAGASWAVVTGATDGIGKAYAFELARRGFNVFLVSRTQSKLDETKKEINEKYANVEIRTAAYDFTNASTAGYKELLATLNQVDIGVLINNVGLSYEYPDVLHKVDGGIERLANITTINTLPPTLLSSGILPQMVARKAGVIVNVGSSAGANQMALWAVYSATKAADTLGHALQTGQLGPVLAQFGMNEETVQAASQGDLRGFAKNLTKAEGQPEQGESSEEPKPRRCAKDRWDELVKDYAVHMLNSKKSLLETGSLDDVSTFPFAAHMRFTCMDQKQAREINASIGAFNDFPPIFFPVL